MDTDSGYMGAAAARCHRSSRDKVAMNSVVAWNVFNERLANFEGRVPNTEEYQELCGIVTEHPMTVTLSQLDPFSAEYRKAVMTFYLDLRGPAACGYDVARDERSGMVIPADIWSGLSPWSFRDPRFISEFLFSWAQIMRLLDVKPDDRVIEYGPGSGQLLLMLARSGIKAYGVDIDEASLNAIRAQAKALNLNVSLEQNVFGEGFEGELFDGVVFFEAFHHAFDFEALLSRLRSRVKRGGKIVLCGEPIVPGLTPNIPYPWGPRLDALSIFCMRRYGWMELGFTQDFVMEAFHRAGWRIEPHLFPICSRASAYVAVRQDEVPDPMIVALSQERDAADAERRRLEVERNDALALVEAFRTSTSWMITKPLRLLGSASIRLRNWRHSRTP
jgi:2-polyprenyl-3-methyl-5-hydroxy-6-metoxy-1,4-benzoquinol methylase